MVGAHVFVVNRFTFPVHRDRRFCGVVNPSNTRGQLDGLIADLNCIRKGDLVFFYKNRTDEGNQEEWGFHGIYKVISEPFFDNARIMGIGDYSDYFVPGRQNQIRSQNHDISNAIAEGWLMPLPNRVLIEPKEDMYFEKSVPDKRAYIDKADKDHLWTMIFRKVGGAGRPRSITHLLPEERNKLIRLLYKINLTPTDPPVSRAYPRNRRRNINIDFRNVQPANPHRFRFENTFRAWLAMNIDKNNRVLREVLGPINDIEYFGNEILYGPGGDKVDFICLHKKEVDDGTEFRYKVSVIETKKDDINEFTIFQAQEYSKWMAQLVPDADISIVQQIIIGSDIEDEVIELAQKSKHGFGRQPILIEYEVRNRQVRLTRKL